MSDVREAIMARLLEIAAGVPTVANAYRNIKAVSDDKLPALVVLEGEEEADETDPPRRVPQSTRRIHMRPQILIASGAPPEEIGTDLNTLRLATIDAVLHDDALRELTLDETGVRYEGMDSELQFGRSMIGNIALRFRLTYALKPHQF